MPTTRLESLVVVAGLAGAAVLAVLTVVAWRDYRDSTSDKAPAAVERPPPTTAGVAATVADVPVPRPTPPANRTTLVVSATRGDSWLAVYNRSASGDRLFEGILTQGRRVSFTRKRFWVRFGFPSNLTATLDGKAVDLPSGTASAIVQGRKLRIVQLG